ncbi:hypothetical protein [Methanobacterium oryzae]|uniref:hypothetical protein n=1 Tax=Methanobacterium oryzae TaxID=69540 RepID=UPI003D1CF94D
MDLDKEVDSIYGKSPAINGYRIKNISEVKNNGYLVCHSCKGYYELNDNESIEDFYGCECGNPLTYHENIADIFKTPHFNKNYDQIVSEYDEYAELQQIVDILRNKATERKRFLENLCERVMIQEEVLNEIKYDRINEFDDETKSVWDLMEEKSLKNEISGQKKIIHNVIEQENKLLSHIQDKRTKNRSIAGEIFTTSLTKISILTVSVIVIALLLIYLLK